MDGPWLEANLPRAEAITSRRYFAFTSAFGLVAINCNIERLFLYVYREEAMYQIAWESITEIQDLDFQHPELRSPRLKFSFLSGESPAFLQGARHLIMQVGVGRGFLEGLVKQHLAYNMMLAEMGVAGPAYRPRGMVYMIMRGIWVEGFSAAAQITEASFREAPADDPVKHNWIIRHIFDRVQ